MLDDYVVHVHSRIPGKGTVNEPATIQIVLFSVLFGAAILWLLMVVWVFRRLRMHHRETFEAIGSPNLVFNNTPRTNWLFFKFLYGRGWKQLKDWPLVAMLGLMRWYLVGYFVVFIALFVADFIR